MNPSQKALMIIKEFEGFSPKPYLCPAGKRTIGYGHVILAHERFPTFMSRITADALLQEDASRVARGIESMIEWPVTQNQFDAMLCLAYNIGNSAFAGSTLLKKLNSGDIAGAADEFLRWDKVTNPKTGQKEPLAGLTKRRMAERKLFLGDQR